MLRDVGHLHVPGLDAFHRSVEVRTPELRVCAHRGRNVASDFGLLERCVPFLHRLTRPAVSVLLEGRGRFEEDGRRVAVAPGDFVHSDQARAGTEAYTGTPCAWITVDWDPALGDGPARGLFEVGRIRAADREHLAAAAAGLDGAGVGDAVVDIFAILRANGLPVERVAGLDLDEAQATDQRLQAAVARHLSNLAEKPAIEDVASDLGWNARRVHRRLDAIAAKYAFTFSHWRGSLHYARLLAALRLLSAPEATTRDVARRTGFRAPSALCHAFSEAGLPSPRAPWRARHAATCSTPGRLTFPRAVRPGAPRRPPREAR